MKFSSTLTEPWTLLVQAGTLTRMGDENCYECKTLFFFVPLGVVPSVFMFIKGLFTTSFFTRTYFQLDNNVYLSCNGKPNFIILEKVDSVCM